jgi:clumping factor A
VRHALHKACAALALVGAVAAAATGCEAVLGLGDLGDRPADGGGDVTLGPDAPAADSSGSDSATDAGSDSSTGSEASPGDAHADADAGAQADGDAGPGVDAGGDGPADSGSDVSCGTVPTLHPTEAGALYCGLNADASVLTCTPGQMCCVGGSTGTGGFYPDSCSAWGLACQNGVLDGGPGAPVTVECNQIADCRANGAAGATACCLRDANNATVPGCGFPKLASGSDIVCEGDAGGDAATPCPVGEYQVCTSQADCASGTCTAGKWKIFQLGTCQ